MKTPLITAIVSTYNAERFMRGCLEDLLGQSIADEVEILVIDSGSAQNEGEICREFSQRHENIRYVRTQRETLYQAWNRAIGMARGKYLTSANTDDRHRHDAFERHAEILEANSHVALVYADQLTSFVENECFEACLLRGNKVLSYPDFSHSTLLLACTAGSQPIWRSQVHQKYGCFDTSFKISADHEFWLRLSQTETFHHIPESLGVFYVSENTLSGANNAFLREMELMQIQLKYLGKEPWGSDQGIRKALAREIFGTGYRFVRAKQMKLALPFLQQAWRLDPFNPKLLKTYVLRGLQGVIS